MPDDTDDDIDEYVVKFHDKAPRKVMVRRIAPYYKVKPTDQDKMIDFLYNLIEELSKKKMEEIINSGKEFPLVSDGDDEYDNNDRHSPLAPLIAQIITAHLNKLPEYQEAFQAIKTLHYSSAQIPKPSAENKITAASKTQILMDYYLNLKDAKTLEELEQIQLNFKTKKEYNILEQHRNPFGSGKTKSIMATETIYSTIRQEIEQKQKQLQLQEKIIDHSEKMLSFFNNKKECVDKIRQYHEFGEIVSLVFNDPLQREASRDKKRTKSQY